MADWAKSSGAKQFLFISSAGIYKPADELPHVEGVCKALTLQKLHLLRKFVLN